MAAERVAAKQYRIENQHQRSHTDSEMFYTIRSREPQRPITVKQENEHENNREVQKIAMDVLQNQRKFLFAAISLARLPNRARERIHPESLVVSAAIVVASEGDQPRKRKDQHGRREWQKGRPPRRRRSVE